MPTTYSPLRYPGGKTKLRSIMSEIFTRNDLIDGTYVEPFAGGAGLGLFLLLNGFTRNIVLNDLDRSIYALWYTILNDLDSLCKRIDRTKITIAEWEKQKQIQMDKAHTDLFELGFSTLFLNRTNRSGILNAGVIGGYHQSGKYKIDARFNKAEIIRKSQMINYYKSKIRIYNLDAIEFLNTIRLKDHKTLIYLDPPYYSKGQELYQNFYIPEDHEKLSFLFQSVKPYWIMTYDNVEPIRKLYGSYPQFEIRLFYSAQNRYQGEELLIIDPRLKFKAGLSVPLGKTANVNSVGVRRR
jgi:DNA adenine methylase